MTDSMCALIFTMLKNKYSGKYIREVFPDVYEDLYSVKFDELEIDEKCMGIFNILFCYFNSESETKYFTGDYSCPDWKEFNIYEHISDIEDLI